MEHGEQGLHFEFIEYKHGIAVVEELNQKKGILKSYTLEELETLIVEYKEKIQELHEARGRDKRRTVTNRKRKDPNILFDL